MAKPVELIFSCEHASHSLPPGVDLGLDEAALRSQASWDPGALSLSAALAARFGKHVFAGHYSRLWVDLNRNPVHPDVIPTTCYGLAVAANAGLADSDRARRLAQYHAPFRHAVETAVRACIEDEKRCVLVSWHSFAPEMFGELRPDPVGVLFDPRLAFEQNFAEGMLEAINKAGVSARPNYPYVGYTDGGNGLYCELRRRFGPEEYAGIEVETRFDGLDQGADIAAYVDLYEQVLRQAIAALG